MAAASLTDVVAAAEAHGLAPRGAFLAVPEDAVPEIAPGRPAVSLVLLGAVGTSLWPHFRQSAEYRDGAAHPLDRWSARVVGALAEALGGLALFPFGGPPYRPFIRWARRAEPVAPSAIGILMHPRHGLWHSYRGALAFERPLAGVGAGEQEAAAQSPICQSCAEKPCLTACPVDAFRPEGYDVARCRAHVGSPDGSACLQGGCLARRACPVSPHLHYESEQAAFHMRSFLGG